MAQRQPSAKTIYAAFADWITEDQAHQIRAVMIGAAPRVCRGCRHPLPTDGSRRVCQYFADGTCRSSRMAQIDAILETSGVEYVPAGRTVKSPAFYYCNAGDTYAVTILKVGDHFRIGTWGDQVERGQYD